MEGCIMGKAGWGGNPAMIALLPGAIFLRATPLCPAGHLPLKGRRIAYDSTLLLSPSPPRGEGGPKGRMRGLAHRLTSSPPPHPAAATFSPRGEGARRAASSICNSPALKGGDRQVAGPSLISSRWRWAKPRPIRSPPLRGRRPAGQRGVGTAPRYGSV
nr:hypothetical protein SHINE37_40594 [Rhizobiaceae bacterium]